MGWFPTLALLSCLITNVTVMAYYTERKRNTPVATLIKNFANKKSGKVVDSRKEIQRRFDYLDWKDQKIIIQAFLDSGKADRNWAYSMALDYWDKSFEQKIRELWEQFHEEKCSWAVIRYFPLEYLSQNLDKLSENRNYFFVCLRLAVDKNFVIDKDKLSQTDYLAVLYHTGRTIQWTDAETLLYDIVHDLCLGNGSLELDRFTEVNKGTIVSPTSFHSIRIALYYLGKMGIGYLLEPFYTWNEKIQKAIFESPEYKELFGIEISDSDYRYQIIKIARKYTYMLLDDKYKKSSDPTIEEMLKPKEWYCIFRDEEWERMREQRELAKQNTDYDVPEPANSNPAWLKDVVAKNPALEKLLGNFGLDINTDSELPPFSTSLPFNELVPF